MNRRSFLANLARISAASLALSTLKPTTTTRAQSGDPLHIQEIQTAEAIVRLVKKQTRIARRSPIYSDRVSEQAEYAADSRIYSLWYRSSGELVAIGDRPAIMYPTQETAYQVAIHYNLFVTGNCVVAREWNAQG